jgi:hypothetical protein
LEVILPYFRILETKIQGIEVGIIRWLPENGRNDIESIADAEHPPMLYISDGTISDFKSATELHDFMSKLKNSNKDAFHGGIRLPRDALGEISKALVELAGKIHWFLVP